MNFNTFDDLQSLSLIAVTSALGAVVLFLCLCFKKSKSASEEKQVDDVSSNGTKAPVVSKKQPKVSRKLQRQATFTFNHPYLHTTLKGHGGQVFDLDASINGKYLASCDDDRSVRLWSVKDFGTGNKSIKINVEYDHAKQIQFSPDSRAFLAGLSQANTIRVFKLGKKDEGTTTATPLVDFPQHCKENLLNVGVGTSSSGGSFVLTAYDGTTILIRDLKGEVLHTINTNQGNNHYAAVSPCGRFVASAGWTPDVKVWAVVFSRQGAFQSVTRAFELKGHTSSVWSFDFNNDSTRMITIAKEGRWRFYDTLIEYEKGQEPYLLNSGNLDTESFPIGEQPCKIALSPDGKVAAVSCSTNIVLFSTATGKKELELRDVHSELITAIKFDIAGRYFLSTGDKHIRVFYNTLGYKETIQELEKKIKSATNSSTRERMQKRIDEAKKALAEIEKRKEQNKTKT